ncbi:acyl carrier protein [Micromonospora sp. KC721]|uniref:acyl carrier protein n=1 Tax=Micromonospora sp. KC721 TaxID=2530380 RepID=UPI00140509B9|nr:acyl carrier protein [Micromonospora sp. KC721]
MLSKGELRQAVAEAAQLGQPADIPDDDAELVLDSLSAAWLVHILSERHGIQVDDEDLVEFTSVNRIYDRIHEGRKGLRA